MLRSLAFITLALTLAACTSTPPGTPSSSTAPTPVASGAAPTSQAAAFNGVTLTVDGVAATVLPTLTTSKQGAGDSSIYAYLLGLTTGQPVPLSDWTVTVGYGKAGNTTSLTASISQRITAAPGIANYSFLTSLGADGKAGYTMPTGAIGTATDNGSTVDVHVTGSFTAIVGGSGAHQLDLTVKGLPKS